MSKRSRAIPQIQNLAVISGFIVLVSAVQLFGEPIDVVDKTGVDVLCKGRGAYTGPTTLSNYSSCMFNDGSVLECNNKTNQCTSKSSPKAQSGNQPKIAPRVQGIPGSGTRTQGK